MAIHSAAHLIQLVSARAHVLLIMSRDSFVSIGQKLRFHGSFSLIYCLHLAAIGLVRPYAAYRSPGPCTQSSGTPSRAMTSSAQVGDRYVGGPTRKLIR